jgi:hypothetical protein
MDMEGSLFVFARNANQCTGQSPPLPKFGFIIMNTKSKSNFTEDINEHVELSKESPYLLYKNNSGGIFCVWFYSATDCDKIHETIRHVMDNPDTAFNPFMSNGDSNGGDVMGLLMRGLQRNGINAGGAAISTPQANGHAVSNHASYASATHSTSVPNGSQATTVNSIAPNVQELFTSLSLSPQKPLPGPSTLNSQKATPQNKSGMANNRTNGASSSAVAAGVSGHGQSSNGRNVQGRRRLDSTPQTNSASPPTVTNQAIPGGDRGQGQAPREGQAPPQSLTMQQLKTTLINLLKNDADFLHTIHSAYIESLPK